MVIALGAFAATAGLVVVFFIVFPILVNGLIAFAIAQSLGEREDNREYAANVGIKQPGHRG
jgi:hypothetical protein